MGSLQENAVGASCAGFFFGKVMWNRVPRGTRRRISYRDSECSRLSAGVCEFSFFFVRVYWQVRLIPSGTMPAHFILDKTLQRDAGSSPSREWCTACAFLCTARVSGFVAVMSPIV